ncbi:MAG TPA: DUF6526 family protein [Candidatus Sulfotelmatobacter sp.]|nr:DUF6526 family protein [Candidatus Sulfotelmatobacter sp.]
MAERKPQTFANHVRFDPLFHFFAFPVFALAVIWSIVHFIRHPGLHTAGLFVLLTAAAIMVLKTRLYALRVQDRVIRLEERLRLSGLLSDPLRSRLMDISEDQLIGLRFCSDAEVPAAVERALTQNSKRQDIKKGVQNWRPDYWRV